MRRRFWMVTLGLWVAFFSAAEGAEGDLPSLIPVLSQIPKKLDFCGERVPLEDPDVYERLEKEVLLAVWNRAHVLLWLKRTHRYLPAIEEALKQAKVPDDLKFLMIAESAIQSHAASSKGAVGFWQFIPETGKRFGLTIDKRMDERRNIMSSTRAAIQYLTRLKEMFDSWTLAAAAYNMGENGLMTEITEQGVRDYYRLWLPLETQRYVFRIVTIKTICSNPERFGFRLAPEDYYRPYDCEEVVVECPTDVPIRIVAEAAKTYFKKIRDLNPELSGHTLTKGTHTLFIPRGAKTGFQTRYQDLLKRLSRVQEEKVHVVKEGDTLTSIAHQLGVPLSSLLRWNRLDPKHAIHPGDRLVVQQPSADKQD